MTIKKSRYNTTKVKTARGRKPSSTRWLQRQLNDDYVKEAKRLGYRSRAAFKLIQLQDKLNIFHSNQTIIDLGAAPGSWLQILIDWIKAPEKGQLIAIDLLEIDPLPECHFIQGDFLEEDVQQQLIQTLDSKLADVIVSDIAPNTTGHKQTDHLRLLNICEEIVYFADSYLKPSGHIIMKIFKGGGEHELIKDLKAKFKTVKTIKPDASRADSSEAYLVCLHKKN